MRLNSLNSYRRFLADKRGSTAMVFALVATPMVMFVGGATDFGNAYRLKSKLQSSADAAALAGANLADATTQQRTSEATNVFAANIASTPRLAGVVPQVQVAANGQTTVTSSYSMSTAFLGIMHLATLTVGGNSIASPTAPSGGTQASPGKACILALDPQSNDGLHAQGDNHVNYTDCWAHTNSTKPTAINAVGNNATMNGTGHCTPAIALNLQTDNSYHNNYTPAPQVTCPVVPDPFAIVGAYETLPYVPTFIPPTLAFTCKASNLNLKKGTYTLDPGRYCGGISMQAQANVTLNAGIYVIDDGILNVQSGSSLSGSNVLLYFRGANARFTIIGGGTINLKGRSPTASYASFLMIASPEAWAGQSSNIQGGGTFNMEGVLYMPKQRIEVAGNGHVNLNTKYFGMVAKDFYFRGNGTFNAKKHSASTLTDIMPTMPNRSAGGARLN